MEWFPGSIVEAIATAKSRSAIFVVYIHDASDASKATDEALNDGEVLAILNSEHFVSIMLENGADNAKQFSQIYPLVLVPSLFFISGQTGVPLEVLGGPLSADNLKLKLNKLLPSNTKAGATSSSSSGTSALTLTPTPTSTPAAVTTTTSTPVPEAAAPTTPPPSETALEPVTPAVPKTRQEPQGQEDTPEAMVEEGKTEVPPSAEGGSGEVAAGGGAAALSAECPMESQDSAQPGDGSREVEDESLMNQDSLSLEEKVERAKVLLAEKQAKDAREKAEETRRKEVERRKMGQEIAKRKQQQDEDSLRAAAMERKKDKQEDREAREKVKAQIAQDRAEREARAALFRGEQSRASSDSPPAPAPQPNPVPSTSNTTRLKFRLPDGYTSTTQFVAQFPADATLSAVRQHILDNVTPPLTAFSLASTVHQGAFRLEDESATLRDLGLVPSAILAVLPGGSGGGSGRVVSKVGGRLWDILWLLLTPITFLLSMVRSLVGGGGSGERRMAPSSSANGPSEPKRPREEGSATTRYRPSTAYGSRGESRLRREGNIHRLNNPDDDDDDENNTWNGNSTQQM